MQPLISAVTSDWLHLLIATAVVVLSLAFAYFSLRPDLGLLRQQVPASGPRVSALEPSRRWPAGTPGWSLSRTPNGPGS